MNLGKLILIKILSFVEARKCQQQGVDSLLPKIIYLLQGVNKCIDEITYMS